MQWVFFLVLGVVALTLQSALAPHLALLGSRPDWLLAIVVFVALRARPFDAIAGAWVLGAGADLMTVERFGLLALSYGTVAVLVSSVRELLFCHRVGTQFAVTCLASLLLQGVWLIYRHVLYDPAAPLLLELAEAVLLGSIYTALWAPLWHKLLSPLIPLLGMPRVGRGSGRLRHQGGGRRV